uniref:Uncharacterized protein n=1 Tax=uncultured Bacteroidota bacterium TaxID=152509 RepID=H5SHJ9_9BACT|nr:hypothetical protein HGMM_F29C06C16 [uncultured Bacteroidetes bacterium]
MGNEMIPRIQIMREDWASVWPTKVEILTMLNACVAKVNYAFGVFGIPIRQEEHPGHFVVENLAKSYI